MSSYGSSAVIIRITYSGQEANECALTMGYIETLFKTLFAAHHQTIINTSLKRYLASDFFHALTNVQKIHYLPHT